MENYLNFFAKHRRTLNEEIGTGNATYCSFTPASTRPSLHYLKAVHDLKSDADGAAVVAKMKSMPTDDKLFGKGEIRADGRKIHPMYLTEVKSPGREQGSLGLLQGARHHPGQRGIQAARRWRLPAGEVDS